ncbi:MAG: PAS domain-containing protein [Spirochaetales bacterium]|nr:PAS domain-containing protein [Spirochaetales bacterium]
MRKMAYANLFQNLPDMFFRCKENGILEEVNPTGNRFFAHDRKSIVGMNLLDFFAEKQNQSHFSKKLLSGNPLSDYEVYLRKRNEENMLAQISLIPLKSANGTTCGYEGILKDITTKIENEAQIWKTSIELAELNIRLKEAQATLVEQEKMASIGLLAAGIAHEINNPVGYVKSNFLSLRKYLESLLGLIHSIEHVLSADCLDEFHKIERNIELNFIEEDVEMIFSETAEGFDRIMGIINSLKSFSRIESEQTAGKFDLNEAIESTLIVARHEYKYIAKVEKVLSEIPLIECNGGEINQVLLNLIVNAAQAIKSGKSTKTGCITISTWQENHFVFCRISDNGPGIPADHVNRIFDPFFTTKPVGQGTGLGLSIAYDVVVNKHHGRLITQNANGAQFTMILPIHEHRDRETQGNLQ